MLTRHVSLETASRLLRPRHVRGDDAAKTADQRFSVYSWPGGCGEHEGGVGPPSLRAGGLGAPVLAFCVPVDAELKAHHITLLSLARPHMRAFHLAWSGLFAAFFATFAPAALLPLIRDALGLTAQDVTHAAIATMCTAIPTRAAMGLLVDALGPRWAAALGLLLTAPATLLLALADTPAAFIAARAVIGASLALFVVDQAWCSAMFTPRIVGVANAVTAGWGNAGAGVSLLAMPTLAAALVAGGTPPARAWRWACLLPGVLQLLVGAAVLAWADDAPEGRQPRREWKRGGGACSFAAGWRAGLLNYRTWLLALLYGCCFGVEMTVNNVLVLYLHDHFDLSLTSAGLLAAASGLLNLGSRALGGLASDVASHAMGMRGRLWVMWALLVATGALCLALGLVATDLAASVAVLLVFSFCCQAACGAVYGVVPFVAHRCNGLVSGVVASGGSLGAIVTQATFFGFVDLSFYQGFIWMGVVVMAVSTCALVIHFPQWGSMMGGPASGATEESYYLSEFTAEERAQGLHVPALKMAVGTRGERGRAHSAAPLDASASNCREGSSRSSTPNGGGAAWQGRGPSPWRSLHLWRRGAALGAASDARGGGGAQPPA